MNPRALDEQEKAAFLRAVESMKGKAAESLRELIDPRAWDGEAAKDSSSLESCFGPLTPESLHAAGLDELGAWLRWLPTRERRRVRRLLVGRLKLQPPRNRPVRKMEPEAVVCFRTVLLSSGERDRELLIRAGLHHLARGLADRSSDGLQDLVRGLPGRWATAVVAMHARLRLQRSTRLAAKELRRTWSERRG
jgi:hypothetical protein